MATLPVVLRLKAHGFICKARSQMKQKREEQRCRQQGQPPLTDAKTFGRERVEDIRNEAEYNNRRDTLDQGP